MQKKTSDIKVNKDALDQSIAKKLISNIRKNLANIITLCNLFCGCLGITYVMMGDFVMGQYFMFAGLGFDFFDGLVARLIGSDSDLGRELDSLADMVTFGVLPGSMIYKKLCFFYSDTNNLIYIGFLYPLFTAFRLAKFNIDSNQSHSFKGVPSPAGAIFIASFMTLDIHRSYLNIYEVVSNEYSIIIGSLILGILLVSNREFIALKFKTKSLKANLDKIFLVLFSVLLILFFRNEGIFISFILYLIVSGVVLRK